MFLNRTQQKNKNFFSKQLEWTQEKNNRKTGKVNVYNTTHNNTNKEVNKNRFHNFYNRITNSQTLTACHEQNI